MKPTTKFYAELYPRRHHLR